MAQLPKLPLEFQAIILSGPGNSLYPLTNSASDSLPKALLPIGNKPLLEFVIEWIEEGGIYGKVSTIVVWVHILTIL